MSKDIGPKIVNDSCIGEKGLGKSIGGFCWTSSPNGTGVRYVQAFWNCDDRIDLLKLIKGEVVDSICFFVGERKNEEAFCFLLLTKGSGSKKNKLHFIEAYSGVRPGKNGVDSYCGASLWYSTEVGLNDVIIEEGNVIKFNDSKGNSCLAVPGSKAVVALKEDSFEMLCGKPDSVANNNGLRSYLQNGQVSNEDFVYRYDAETIVWYNNRNETCRLLFELISSKEGLIVELISVSSPLEKEQLENDETMVWELIKQAFAGNKISCVDSDLTRKVIAMNALSQALYGNTKPFLRKKI